jgi:phosphoglycerate dehydrogenase-like enzyme
MLLGLSCRVHLANDRSRGMTGADVSLRGFELRDRTLGVIGTGRIGRRVGELARAFGMRVLGHDPNVRQLPGVEPVGLRELLTRSDAVVLCCSYQREAPPTLGSRELIWCRPGAVVVNVSRAALVDHDAVAVALRTRQLRGYAIDDAVFSLDAHDDLVREGRVLQTGHSAWWRDETLARGGVMWAEQIRRLAIGDPVDVVNPPRRLEQLAG